MRKYLSTILGILVLVLGIAVFKLMNTKNTKTEKKVNTPETVKVITKSVTLQDIPYAFEATGTLEAKDKIELYSEVQGVLLRTKTSFKIGNSFKKGETIISINSEEHQAQIKSSRSDLVNQIAKMLPDMEIDYPQAFEKWDFYLSSLDITKLTPKLPIYESNEEKLFVSGKDIYKTYYNIKNLEERLNKYSISAPFNGIVTESNVNLGTLIRNGQKIGEIINNSIFELQLAIPASENKFIVKGKEVVLSSVDGTKSYTGKITRINGKVNQNTQSIEVIVEVKNSNLKDGQYLKAQIHGKNLERVVSIDNALIQEGNKIYVVINNVLELVEITPVNYQGNKTLVKGLRNETIIVNQNIANAFPGMVVETIN